MTTGKKPDGKESQELLKLKAEFDALKKEAERLREIAGRAQADLQNAKSRLERDRQEMSKFALEGVLVRLLPTIDSFQRAFKHLPQDLKEHDWVEGVGAIEQELVKQVTEFGLRKMDALGAALDPEKHEVLQAGPGEEGKVIEVYAEGYEFQGKVLRPAKVKVGNGVPQGKGAMSS